MPVRKVYNGGESLPLWWWVRHWRYDSAMPYAYVCPFLATLAVIWHRLRGKPAEWRAGRYGKSYEDGEEIWGYITPARIIIGHCEASIPFPRQWIEAECDFWNSKRGIKLEKWMRNPRRGV